MTEMYQKFVIRQCWIVGVAVKEGQQLDGVELSPGLFKTFLEFFFLLLIRFCICLIILVLLGVW